MAKPAAKAAPDDPTVTARNAQLVALAQYVIAVDGTKVCEGPARTQFAAVQAAAGTILLDQLAKYRNESS